MYFLLSVEFVESVMSAPLLAAYRQWLLDNPQKQGRLAAIIQQTAAEFRSAIQANGLPLSDDRATALPESCLRYAQTTILFELKKEIGLTMSESENAAAIRADVFLRGIWTGAIPATLDGSIASPSYKGATQ
ncbi:MAG: hypothetical protein HOO88_05670 [Kiritimatiellaceae bacterium]|nr:hypothetical protein [Kiritimatiellaceae bacterium]